MSHPNQAFGIMDEAYFVPRSEIINWIKNLLNINVPRIQALGAGNVYCQIMDVIYPGKIAISKVNWKARLDYEFISNLKILQAAFDKLGIKKHIDVEKIARAKYQDNLELIQWFKRYFDVNCGGRGDNYPAQQRRGFIEPDFSFAQKVVIPKTYNGSGQCTYNQAPLKSKKESFHNVEHQSYPKKSSGVYYQNQNVSNNGQKAWKGKSASDQKLESIKGLLASQLSSDQKVTQILGIVNSN